MIAFEMDIKEKEELGYWVFDWDENRYRLLVEYVPNELKVCLKVILIICMRPVR